MDAPSGPAANMKKVRGSQRSRQASQVLQTAAPPIQTNTENTDGSQPAIPPPTSGTSSQPEADNGEAQSTRTESTDDSDFDTLQDAVACVARPEEEECTEMKIAGDDWKSVQEGTRQFHDFVIELFNAIKHEPSETPVELDLSTVDFFNRATDHALTRIKAAMQCETVRARAWAYCLLAMNKVVLTNKVGVPTVIVEAAKDSSTHKLKPDLKLPTSERARRLILHVRENKSFAKDVMEGTNLDDMAYSPDEYLKRKLSNVKSNQKRREKNAKAKTESEASIGGNNGGKVAKKATTKTRGKKHVKTEEFDEPAAPADVPEYPPGAFEDPARIYSNAPAPAVSAYGSTSYMRLPLEYSQPSAFGAPGSFHTPGPFNAAASFAAPLGGAGPLHAMPPYANGIFAYASPPQAPRPTTQYGAYALSYPLPQYGHGGEPRAANTTSSSSSPQSATGSSSVAPGMQQLSGGVNAALPQYPAQPQYSPQPQYRQRTQYPQQPQHPQYAQYPPTLQDGSSRLAKNRRDTFFE